MTLKKYYIAQAYRKVATAGSKPSMDFEKVLKRNGYKNLGLPSISTNSPTLWWIWNWLSAHLAILRMPKHAVVAIQYPDQRHICEIFKKLKLRKNKAITLIHDINELRQFPFNYPEILELSDVLISHTNAMKSWLQRTYAEKRVAVLGIFDYMVNNITTRSATLSSETSKSIVFAGALGKSKFIKGLKFSHSDLKFVLYGPGITDDVRNNDVIDYRGICSPDELLYNITDCNYGLVWDGESINECTGATGEYLKYNCPYKLSSYIAAGLPVIVWDKMAMAPFVQKYNIGISVSSLLDLPEVLSKITSDGYALMRRNAERMKIQLRKGEFYERALSNAESMIEL